MISLWTIIIVYTHVLILLLQDGKTALHLAALKGHSEELSELIQAGADVETKDKVSRFCCTSYV